MLPAYVADPVLKSPELTANGSSSCAKSNVARARDLVLRPVPLEGVPRIVCRTATGEPIDLEPPSRDAQRGRGGRTGKTGKERWQEATGS